MTTTQDQRGRTIEVDRLEAEMEALCRMLLTAEGVSSLSVAVCNSPALCAYVIGKARQSVSCITEIVLPEQTTDIYASVVNHVGSESPGAIFLLGMERTLSPQGSGDGRPDKFGIAMLRSLNASRDLWCSFQTPIVLWLPDFAATMLARFSPDFWRYLSHHFEFKPEGTGLEQWAQEWLSGDPGAVFSYDERVKHLRAAELEHRIAALEGQPTPGALPHLSAWTTELAFIRNELGEWREAEALLQRDLEVSRNSGQPLIEAVALTNLAALRAQRGKLDEAEELLRNAWKIEQALGRESGIVLAMINLAALAVQKGKLGEAESLLLKALPATEKLGQRSQQANVYLNLGLVCRNRKELDRAEDYTNRALAIYDALGRRDGMGKAYSNLGTIFGERGNLKRAEEAFKHALQIHQELGRQAGVATSFANLGVVSRLMDNNDEARAYYLRSLEIAERVGMKNAVATARVNLGKLDARLQRIDAAIENFSTALQILDEIGASSEADRVRAEIRHLRHVHA